MTSGDHFRLTKHRLPCIIGPAHKHRLIIPLPVFGATGTCVRSGNMCCPDHAIGKVTFAQWLTEQYATA